MNQIIRNYETLYIVDSTLNDEQVESIISRYSTLITDQGGEVQAAGRWDRRRLAYEIKGRREGLYILMYFTGEPALAKELDRQFRIADDVFRHLIARVEPQHVDTTRIDQPVPAPELVEPEAEGLEAAAEEMIGEVEPAEPAAAGAPEETDETETPAEAEAVQVEPAEELPVEEVVVEEPAEEPVGAAEAEPPVAEEPAEEADSEEPRVEPEEQA